MKVRIFGDRYRPGPGVRDGGLPASARGPGRRPFVHSRNVSPAGRSPAVPDAPKADTSQNIEFVPDAELSDVALGRIARAAHPDARPGARRSAPRTSAGTGRSSGLQTSVKRDGLRV